MKATRIDIGILAHVDAGKTTLAEALLKHAGSIRRAGRVDHGDAFLDTDAMEKERGITIFAKQAQLMLGELPVTLLDTPGHVDFSAEMERTLRILDYGLLVISGSDGVQSHVLTLWKLLEKYHIPVFLFINKMDQPGTDREKLMRELKERLGDGCVCFGRRDEAFWEELALCDDQVMEDYLDGRLPGDEQIAGLIRARKLFPCLFGSALRFEGVDRLASSLERYLIRPAYPEAFSARVFKISRLGPDRLTFLKVTGGVLKVKQSIGIKKVDQIRLYSGAGYRLLPEAGPGEVCAVTGLSDSFAGQGLGANKEDCPPMSKSVLSYSLRLPEGTDLQQTYRKLRELEEEMPEMHLTWMPETGRIQAQVMGEVQLEILRRIIADRYGLAVDFDEGAIVYRETLTGTVEGVGHFEPLRHYAEVHLLLEPGERGSGVTLRSDCAVDVLEESWQHLVLSALAQETLTGVLTGAPLTDIRITLALGRSHLKHTEGGDFREAALRAVRQGLMEARQAGQCLLLEPIYGYRLEVPASQVGRAMTDIQAMHGSWEGPFPQGENCLLEGRAPAALMRHYQRTVTAYTRGAGRLSCFFDGYAPCHDQEKVIARSGYDPEAGGSESAGSVFCAHGAGEFVPWHQVKSRMHLPSVLERPAQVQDKAARSFPREGPSGGSREDEELKAIFERTYGAIRQERNGWGRRHAPDKEAKTGRPPENTRGQRDRAKPPCLLVDGYNIIFAWDDLKELARTSLEAARQKLMDILSNYQGYRQMTLILVFDAYRVPGGEEERFAYHHIYVVYTKEAETADACIERTVRQIAGEYDVTVATSDAAEQIIIWGSGARRMSARELREQITAACREIQTEYLEGHPQGRRYLFDDLGQDMAQLMEQVRLGRKTK